MTSEASGESGGSGIAGEILRAALARRGIDVPGGDLDAGAEQLDGILVGMERLGRHEIARLEPTSYPRFDD